MLARRCARGGDKYMKIIYCDEYLTVSHNSEFNYLHLKWNLFNIELQTIQKMHSSILEYAQKNNIYYYIADTANVSSFLKAEIIGWWRSKWIPELQKSGIEIIFSINTDNNLSSISNTDWKIGLYEYTQLLDIPDLSTAEKIIIENEQKYKVINTSSIDSYINSFHNRIKFKLEEIRTIIQNTIPDAEERISYRIPTYYYFENVIHFGGYDKFISLYPTSSGINHFKDELKGYKISKGTVQFPINKPLPEKLIRKIVLFRFEEARKRKS